MASAQNPRFTSRDLLERDLVECFSVEPPHLGVEIVGFQGAVAAWKSLAGTCVFNGTVIEVDQSVAGHRIVGFGARVFVSRDFSECEIADPRPGLYARLVAGVAAGQPIALTESQVRHANTRCGLDAVIVGGFRYGLLSLEALNVATALLAARFFELHAGYWMHRLITEITSEEYRNFLMSMRVWRVVSNFERFYAQQSISSWTPGRALATITREEALAVTSHGIGPLFMQKRPQLKLRDADQHFLRAALGGLTDEDLSRKLDMSVSSIKKRWLSLYVRISDTQPGFFPQKADSMDVRTRGRQKRHLVIAYIRSHPEELCPFEW